jgi:anti-sigma regulatory factor (Ser/Thr protein kinase)
MFAAGMDADPRCRSLELDLHRDPEAPAVARAAAVGLCQQIGLAHACCQTLLLLVSEIVTNAVIHSKARPGTPIRFSVAANRHHIRVGVHDGGPSFTPESRGGATEHDGWGLRLLDQQAQAWGVEDEQGTLVWFELEVDPH